MGGGDLVEIDLCIMPHIAHPEKTDLLSIEQAAEWGRGINWKNQQTHKNELFLLAYKHDATGKRSLF